MRHCVQNCAPKRRRTHSPSSALSHHAHASTTVSPISGVVVEANDALSDEPEIVNRSAESDGWIFALDVAGNARLDAELALLLDEKS
jgi:glycine cleavage system H lipoate-binding protein